MKEIPNELIALDLETSGTEHGVHSIVSIGMVHIDSGAEYYDELKWDNLVCSPEAFRVHGLDIKQIDAVSKSVPKEADKRARAWLEKVTGSKKQWRLIPVGFNVGGFDMPFVKQDLPKTGGMFSYRNLDLNSATFMLDIVLGAKLKTFKTRFKAAASNKHKHNALADAKEAAEIVRKFVDVILVDAFWRHAEHKKNVKFSVVQ